MGEFVKLEPSRVDRIAVIHLDRPKMNALNAQVGHELLEVANEVAGRLVQRSGP
jgi:enoyl-CoA hydratase/carnithine racemase